MTLENEIAEILKDGIYTCEAGITPDDLANRVVSYIDSLRCVWTKVESNGVVYYGSSCHDGFPLGWSMTMRPFCPCCGKKIEVKDDQG